MAVKAGQPVTIAISPVGSPGNGWDPATGYGNVGYTFGIGTFDITLTQYTTFLNAVAHADSYALQPEPGYEFEHCWNYAIRRIGELHILGDRRRSVPGNVYKLV